MIPWVSVLVLVAACAPDPGQGEADESAARSQTALLRPEQFQEEAPDRFRAAFETTKGSFVVEVTRAWAPHGADRFFNLVQSGFYDDARFFRVVDDFMVSWGIHAHPQITAAWERRSILDDDVVESNTRGRIAFAHHGLNTRTTTVFVNYRDNPAMDAEGFAPFGEVVEGMEVLEQLHAGYGDAPPRGEGPLQEHIRQYGNAYLDRDFPSLDGIVRATIQPWSQP